jgi:nucleoside-diphosphate-sugar epimerase
MAEILLTGGAGNFGRTLAEALRQKGHGLRIFDLPVRDFDFFKGWADTRIITGDILDRTVLEEAVDGIDMIYHLAAILPPASEEDRERTFRVNVQGTQTLLEACLSSGGKSWIIFASSVSVYGDTSNEDGLIGPDHPVNPNDWYAESKVEAENLLEKSGLPFVNLRISGIVIPAFLDPPEPWAFMRHQRIELLALSDLVAAMAALTETGEVPDNTLLLAGGPDWQVTGGAYVKRWGEIMDIPFEEMIFMDQPGWLNWYNTNPSQALLKYQNTPLEDFFKALGQAVEEALA